MRAESRCHRKVHRWPGAITATPLVLATLVAASCSPPERHPDTGIEIPGHWQGATPAATGAVEPRWWASFGDRRLDALVAAVLERNHDLRLAAGRVEEALAQARIAGADVFPRVSADFTASREKNIFVGLPIPTADDDVLTNRFTRVGTSLDFAWEIDLWGRHRAARSAALADLEAAGADFAAARLSLAAQTARIWFGVIEARLQVELARTTAESFRLSAEQVRSRFERGLRPSLDLRLALSNLAAAEALLARRESELDRLVRQLEILAGDYPAGTLEPSSDFPPLPPPTPAGLPSELLRRRPDIVAAERRLAAADRRVAEAVASLFPRISLTASGGTTAEELADLTSRSFSVWSLAGNLLEPVFEGGRLVAGVKLARARARQATESYAAVLLEAFREVETALGAEGFLARREEHLREDVEQASRAETLAEERYTAGLDDYITVLEAQRRALVARGQLLAVRRQRLEARIDLHRALGGGFDDPPAAGETGTAARVTEEDDPS